MPEKDYDLSGVWLSTYSFVSSTNGELMVTDHYVEIHRVGSQIIVQSIPTSNGSYMMARFTLEGRVLTGSYYSQTDASATTKRSLYYDQGAAQMIISEDGKTIAGMGVGYTRDMVVIPSEWRMTFVGKERPSKETLETVRFRQSVDKK
jgi:hypothetical protein